MNDGRGFALLSRGLPVGRATGRFPPAADDDAAAHVGDAAIAVHRIAGRIPTSRKRREPRCVSLGEPIGIATDGVPFLAPSDTGGNDLAARDVVDACGGAPDSRGLYGYRAFPSCLIRGAAGRAGSLVGYARDGFPITTRTGRGRLDRCHGRVGRITIGGASARRYHYELTHSFPYVVGCFRARRARWSVTRDPSPGETEIDAAGLYPEFSRGLGDYVARCDGGEVKVAVAGAPGTAVSIDGGPEQGGSFERVSALGPGQAFEIATIHAGDVRAHHVRCLPADFPTWQFERGREPNNELYFVEPGLAATNDYVVAFDDRGVPIWWFDAAVKPIDSRVLSDGSIAWAKFGDGGGYEMRALDGTLLRTASVPVAPWTDHHDLQELDNGNVLLLSYRTREHVDLSAHGGSADDSVTDGVVHEVDPSGNQVWEWDSKDHVSLEETGRWFPSILASSAHDIVHINAVEPFEDSMLISLRHTDAIYKIDRVTGDVVWKLGGTTTPESLDVLGDPYGAYPFGGQHDSRLQADGSVTVFDNGTNAVSGSDHQPRAVRYEIDEGAGTATLVESVSDPAVPSSFCCGSARRSGSGAWLMSWGGNNPVSEFGPDGLLNFRLDLSPGFSYRAFPVPQGQLTRADLRQGMDAMFPRP